jgi:hypothetical protein
VHRTGLHCLTREIRSSQSRRVAVPTDGRPQTSMAIVEKIRYVRGHETIVSRYSWKTSMNKSIFQLAPWAGPAYLALADAIELAIRVGSVQAGGQTSTTTNAC